jgi:hypothetical protein
MVETCLSEPLDSSFCSMEEMMRQEARRVPTTFLYATDKRFRSSTVNSPPSYFESDLLADRKEFAQEVAPAAGKQTLATSY